MKIRRTTNKLSIFAWKDSIFYGWWLVVLTLLINAASASPVWGGVGVWIDSLEQHFGWSRTQLSFAFSLGQLEGSIVGPLVGILVDRIGPKNVVFLGISIIGVGFILLSQTQSLGMFYLSYAIIMMGASGGGWLPMMTVINNWFDKKRTIAMGFGGLGFSFGSFLLVPALAWMVEPSHAGWQMTALGLGIFFILVGIPITRFIRNSPEEYGEFPDGSVRDNAIQRKSPDTEDIDYSILEVIKSRVFWIISICHGMSSMLISAMMVHLILILRDQGISIQTGAIIWGFTMGFSGISQIIGGFIGDKIPKNIALCVFGCVQAFGVLIALRMESVYWAPIFIIVYGLGFGARIPLGSAIRGEYFGRRVFGKVLGFSMMPMFLMMMFGPLFAGWMYDNSGSYDTAFIILAAIGFVGSGGFLLAKKPPPPRRS